MTSERIEELMKQTAYPESNSVFQAMNQVWNEMQQDFNSRTCGTCKYYISNTMFDSIGDLDCSANNMAQNIVSFPPSDFGCNKWEQKDE